MSNVTTLGAFLRKARSDAKLTQRQVEDATSGEVSNAYLSQLESGKIKSPGPIIHAYPVKTHRS